MSLVRATFELHDGSRHDGFLTPAFKDGDLATLQPHLFGGREIFRFWGGMAGIRANERTAFYEALGKGPEAIFPIRFSTDPDLATGVAAGQVGGFYRGTRTIEVEF
jgi:hypothetical protein